MAEKHYFEQIKYTREYLIPYFERYLPDFRQMRILEIGCAEGGFLDVLHQQGILNIQGLELEESRVRIALNKNPELDIHTGDITDPQVTEIFRQPFDLILMRDTIEHIADRDKTFAHLNTLMNPGGYLYITFPPRFSGFAGHQQNGRTFLRMIPYLHLLPAFLLRLFGRMLNEKPHVIEAAIMNYRIGLTIRKFKKYYTEFGFQPYQADLFLFRPVYQFRFHLRPLKFPNIPLLREFLAFGCEYLLQKTVNK